MSASTESYVLQPKTGPGCLVQILWFFFIGWWLGSMAITVAWVLNVTIIGLPLGLKILNDIPRILTLKPPQDQIVVHISNGITTITHSQRPQLNFLIRAIYFLLVGWWWSGIWMSIAYFICATYILLPLGLKMFHYAPFMTTLKRY